MTIRPMHKEFATWYGRVDLGDDTKRLDARWAGVSALVEATKYEQCEYLLDIFMKKPGVVTGTQSDFMREAFVAADPTFPPSGNEAEMALLAEIILAVLLNTSEEDLLAGYIADLIYSALHGGIVKVNSTTGLLACATHAMRFQGNEVRKRKTLPDAPKTYRPAIKIDDCFEEDSNLADLGTAKTILQKIITKVANAMGDYAKQTRDEREALERALRIQDEELNLLWWASNGQSETTGKQFSSMALKEKSLIAAYEAADRTQFQPGPASICGLLEKAGLKVSKKVSISEAVNDCDEAWLRKIQKDDVTTSTPIHYAIGQRLASPNSTTWSDHWTDVTGINASTKRSEVVIANLFYQERLVLDAYGGA